MVTTGGMATASIS